MTVHTSSKRIRHPEIERIIAKHKKELARGRVEIEKKHGLPKPVGDLEGTARSLIHAGVSLEYVKDVISFRLREVGGFSEEQSRKKADEIASEIVEKALKKKR